MNTGERLLSLGLCEIPKSGYMDGFDKTIVFAFSLDIARHMQRIFETTQIPEIGILRNGIIENNGTFFNRKSVHSPISFTLCYLAPERQKFSCVTQDTKEKVKTVLGTRHNYFLKSGEVFTAQKYFDAWKRLQENPNYIHPRNL